MTEREAHEELRRRRALWILQYRTRCAGYADLVRTALTAYKSASANARTPLPCNRVLAKGIYLLGAGDRWIGSSSVVGTYGRSRCEWIYPAKPWLLLARHVTSAVDRLKVLDEIEAATEQCKSWD